MFVAGNLDSQNEACTVVYCIISFENSGYFLK